MFFQGRYKTESLYLNSMRIFVYFHIPFFLLLFLNITEKLWNLQKKFHEKSLLRS